MSKSIWDVRFTCAKSPMALDAAVVDALFALDKKINEDEGEWRTVNGSHIHINEEGDVDAGAEGKIANWKYDIKERADDLKRGIASIMDGGLERLNKMKSDVRYVKKQRSILEKQIDDAESKGETVTQEDKDRLKNYDKDIERREKGIRNGDWKFKPYESEFTQFPTMQDNGQEVENEATESAEKARFNFFAALNVDIQNCDSENRTKDVRMLKSAGNKALSIKEAKWWNKNASKIEDYMNGKEPNIKNLGLKIPSMYEKK